MVNQPLEYDARNTTHASLESTYIQSNLDEEFLDGYNFTSATFRYGAEGFG